MILRLLFFPGLFFYTISFGQIDSSKYTEFRQQLSMYKKIYDYGDSIKIKHQSGLLDSNIFQITDSLEKMHPYEYFVKAGELMQNFKLNEAAFLFYLGRLRYAYYNSANPKYKASDDGALASSLVEEMSESILMYLKSDADNYLEILNTTFKWYNNHDYQFYPRANSPEKYFEQSNSLNELIKDITKHKKKYQKEWDDEKEGFLTNIDSALNQIK